MKKSIPLYILENLHPLIIANLSLVHVIKDQNTLLTVVDNDADSDFHFKVIKQDLKNAKILYLIEVKPFNSISLTTTGAVIEMQQVVEKLNAWLSLLKAYNEIPTAYDDPITKAYEDEFRQVLEIVDEDADTTPFKLSQQLFLLEYLHDVNEKLEDLKEGKNQEELNKLSELQSEIDNLQKDLPKLTKKGTIRRLSKFWAKAQKTSLTIIKEIFVSVTAELTKRLLIGN